MRRREFLCLLGGAPATWPHVARAQLAGKVPTIGLLVSGTPASHGAWFAVLVQRLRELGWIEGRTVAIEYRWGEGRANQFAEIAAEFVQRKVDIIVTGGNALPAVTKATSTIPVVFALAADPFAAGAVATLARPGGNVTGLSMQQSDSSGKRIELLRELVPGLRRLAVIANVGTPAAQREVDEVRSTVRPLGVELVMLEILRVADIVPAFEGIKSRADALYVVGDAFTSVHRTRIITLGAAGQPPDRQGPGRPLEDHDVPGCTAARPDHRALAARRPDRWRKLRHLCREGSSAHIAAWRHRHHGQSRQSPG